MKVTLRDMPDLEQNQEDGRTIRRTFCQTDANPTIC